jgi:putative ABC transport system substrate-binding protein
MSCLSVDYKNNILLPIFKKGARVVFCALLSLFLLPFSLSIVYAAPDNIVVLSSGKARVYTEITETLKAIFDQPCIENRSNCINHKLYFLTYDDNENSLVIPANTKLVITLGLKSGEVIQKMNTGLPTLHALIPKASADQLTSFGTNNQTTIYLDQPPSRQLQLARLIYKEPHIGLLLGQKTQAFENDYLPAANKQGIAISYRKVASEEMVGPQLKELLDESNILLALPDPTVFNRRTIFNILLSSYHNKVPVIGFSAAYVKAGALVAVYSTPEDIARHLADFTTQYLSTGLQTLPKPEYPKYFSVSVNRSVARSLDISLPEERELIQLIRSESNQ